LAGGLLDGTGDGLLIGEWPMANILLGVAFLVAALGVVGLGWWVMRADHLNRRFEHPGSDDSSES
jgi:hypothetical protein